MTVAAQEQRALCLINNYRSSQGKAPLLVNATISNIARGHSQNMAATGNFSHDGAQARLNTIGQQTGLPYAGGGEIIASNWGYSDPAGQAVSNWINSTPHRNIMLGVGANTKYMGIGVAISSGEVFFTGLTY